MSDLRRCSRCKVAKPLSEYRVSRSDRQGYQRYCVPCGHVSSMMGTLRRRAKKLGLEMTLTEDFVEHYPPTCPCCGRDMERGGNTSNSPSVDRLEPSKGYTPGNCWIVCNRCNTIKQDASPAELYEVADAVWEEYKRRGIPLPETRNRRTLVVEAGAGGDADKT